MYHFFSIVVMNYVLPYAISVCSYCAAGEVGGSYVRVYFAGWVVVPGLAIGVV